MSALRPPAAACAASLVMTSRVGLPLAFAPFRLAPVSAVLIDDAERRAAGARHAQRQPVGVKPTSERPPRSLPAPVRPPPREAVNSATPMDRSS
jgi:hypothetical protein